MATLVLQAAGAAVGALFGPLGAMAGRALGGLAGYALDSALFGAGGTREGARLADLRVQGSREGAAIPRVYGRARISGQVIWATRFEEVASESREGGKGAMGGGNSVRTYSYFANFAIALCEGPVARIGRVWADGKPLDLSGITWRLQTGEETQDVDSLIAAKQGDAPAYRGVATVVFERLPLTDFGNRIPQLSFEVIRPATGLADDVKAMIVIPGATEFGYDPEPVYRVLGPGSRETVNRHVDGARTDWEASIDELTAVCPNLERVGLVVAWFGNDLRAGECTLMPGVVDRDTQTQPENWRAAGLTRATARLVSRVDGRPAYGGTPSDASVIRAIRDLKARGIHVTLYPFIMMDVPEGNGLPDPYGGAEQAVHPWRGRMTLSKAPGIPGSPDGTAVASDEIAAFAGSAAAAQFGSSGEAVTYTGPTEWSYRRFILHYAKLCAVAGGVDAFLIGSEMRGLSTVRGEENSYPFVHALAALAGEARTLLGQATKISYAADWSEYFGHHPADGSGDVFFHLDRLWADENIDFIGIDNYLPLSDWRDGPDHADAALWNSGRDTAYLRAGITGGEYHDWYYANDVDRAAQVRTPITDGAYGKPWVFRAKDLSGWWSNAHYNRIGGVEEAVPTAWVPQSKPIWFTELGCAAVDRGGNQPNVFPDAKSSENALPFYSTGVRDDLMQQRFLTAHYRHWQGPQNPISPIYGEPMVDISGIHLWAWDARPFPAFPLREDIWSDGANWETGHWLNGRLGAPVGDALVRQIAGDYGLENLHVSDVDGTVDGYVIGQLTSARQALEPLARLLFFDARERGESLEIVSRGRRSDRAITRSDLVETGAASTLLTVRRAQETELPSEVSIAFSDPLADYRASETASRRLAGGSRRMVAHDTPAVLTHAVATGIADTMLQDAWASRETLSFTLPPSALDIEAADICALEQPDGTARTIVITRIEDGPARRIEARSVYPEILAPVPSGGRAGLPPLPDETGPPVVWLLDLPLLTGSEPAHAPRIAAFSAPWPGAISVAIGTGSSGYMPRQVLDRRAVMGELAAPLGSGPIARWDRGGEILVRLYGGVLAGEPDVAVLNGANVAAIGTPDGGYEILQFSRAEMIGPGLWRLSGLLRGQAGTADVAAEGHAEGAGFVLLDGAVRSLEVSEAEAELALTLRCGAAGAVFDPDRFVDVPLMPARRALMCLPPAHLAARRDEANGDVTVRWIRQTRTGGDTWQAADVPLGEASEGYRVRLGDEGGWKRTVDVPVPHFIYTAAEQLADFGGSPAALTISVSQVSPTEGPGLAITRVLYV